MMKKQILFAIDSLVCAGGEKSLTTLLSLLDYSKYNVDLFLFSHGLPLEQFVPEEVNILEEPDFIKFSKLTLQHSLVYSIRKRNLRMFLSRIRYSILIRKGKSNNAQKARMFWQSASKVIENNSKEYDIAISYAQGIPTFYIAEKVKAKKKYAWVNVSYRLDDKERKFQKNFYEKYDNIVAVSDPTKDIFLENYPSYSSKMRVVQDINNPDLIFKMADSGESYNDNFNGIRILTVGRLAYQKGYDMALEACKKLVERGVRFRWYAMGKGPLQKEIEAYINENKLSENFILLGVKVNPYPYIKNCDIYVQPSRFEGFGIAIAEARMLNIPVIATRFDSVNMQMRDRQNGLIVDMNSEALMQGIIELIENTELREHIISCLKREKKGNLEEMDRFYKLIEN